MDVKQYFRKLREIEAALLEEYPIVISLQTSDGGKPGLISEVSRFNAAKMIVEGCAVLATEEQKQQFRDQQAAERRAAEKAELSKRLQVAIIADPDAQGHSSHKKSNGPSANGR
jgi:hypothetical protein